MPAYIRLDLFPATVTRQNGVELSPVRAVVTDEQVLIFQDANPQPVEVLTAGLHDFEKVSRTHYRVITDGDLEQIEITRRPGCGCGNKLRGFRPFPGVPLLKS